QLSASVAVLATLSSLVARTAAGPLASSKRGLVFSPNSTTPDDDLIWVQKPTDLTWYYNYQATPSLVFNNISQADFEFVPMLWGAPNSASDTTFLDSVKGLIENRGINISHVLTFNEPDASMYGGSNVDPSFAAQVWVNNIIPLQKLNISVGLPACTGAPTGIPWLTQFLGNCSKIISTGGKAKNCTFDFVPLHWYGDFGGLASHMGEYSAAFPNKTQWITEYNYDNQDLATTQGFYNMSAEYFDRLDWVGRYSMFGAFRSDVSNVGPNAAMLNNDGELTDIGAWYLGRPGTGVNPQSGGSSGSGSSKPKSAGFRAVNAPRMTAVLL
ncbi:glycosyl hydrolase catalytic core-domain-containing protein, partial [Cercophora scortea]